MIVLQSMSKKKYYLGIAEKVYPELKAGRFFTNIKGTEHYFSGLSNTDVKCIYKSFYDEYDYAFSIQCTFSLCDKRSGSRWVRQEGSVHIYFTPVLYVVDRNDLYLAPDRIIDRMIHFYRSNTLVVGSNHSGHFAKIQLNEQMRKNNLQLIYRNEIEIQIDCLKQAGKFTSLEPEKEPLELSEYF